MKADGRKRVCYSTRDTVGIISQKIRSEKPLELGLNCSLNQGDAQNRYRNERHYEGDITL
ncbi:unnamed protein product [Haemonchus placei]|uniref:Transposase n=1 Tax=Haemonchus placei TaxID=6290 RepID=A0A0N4W291_HAEPC|nr:unnamed protein product [Haemonchus placei]